MAANKKLFGLFGRKNSNGEHICGGTTDLTDSSAPKMIKSKEIVQFSASLFLSDRHTKQENHRFHFSIKGGEDGRLIAGEEETGLSAEADEKLLGRLQGIIDENRLVLHNGEYRVTAGLPPEYQPCHMKVDYASGESFKFTMNNDPHSLWGVKIYTAFAEYFAEKGDDSLFPERLCSKPERVDLTFTRGDEMITYGGINVEEDKAADGQTYVLHKRICSKKNYKAIFEKFIPFPEDHFDRLTPIIDKYDLPRRYDFSRYDFFKNDYGNHSRGYYGMGTPIKDEQDSADEFVRMSVIYETGFSMSIKTNKPSEIKGFEPLVKELADYFESLFS